MLEAWHHFSPRPNPGRGAHLLLRFLMISLEFPFYALRAREELVVPARIAEPAACIW